MLAPVEYINRCQQRAVLIDSEARNGAGARFAPHQDTLNRQRNKQLESGELQKLSSVARQAWKTRDWATVDSCAAEILRRDAQSAEGHFLYGLVCKAAQKPAIATRAFDTALQLDPSRYDAAIELAGQHSIGRRNAEAAALIARYENRLSNSPRYLDTAGTVYVEIGLPERAWPLYCKANELQPGIDLFMANLASCGVYLGKIEEARAIYVSLLEKRPNHRRNHYYLARLGKAEDDSHIRQMKRVLAESKLPEDKNVFIYYALGKELEDLGRWAEAFEYYRKAGDAVSVVANYDIAADVAIIDRLIEVCDKNWLEAGKVLDPDIYPGRTPVFIVGLPRTGTTLTERIVSSHSRVTSLGETQFMQMMIRRVSGIKSIESMNADMIAGAAARDVTVIGRGYLDAVAYRLGSEPMFIDKLPYNFLFLGFIAKAYPHARIVHMRRNPMDTCFSMYKQVFTWAYKFSYSLENLGQYFVAYQRLARHWQEVIGARIIDVEYESLVENQEDETRRLLDELGLPFEEACLDFDRNRTASTTASSVQVRQKIHARSVGRWTLFADELEPLKTYLERHGVEVG
jgi:tetratricopeptide (TPR) repeat protein